MLLLDHVIVTHVFEWWPNVVVEPAGDVVLLGLFVWLALRGGRWWPSVIAASLVLMMISHLLEATTPMGRYVALSARLGLWILIYLTLLAGVAERWLAGERPVSDSRRWRERVRPAS